MTENKEVGALRKILGSERYAKQVMWGTDFPIARMRMLYEGTRPPDAIKKYELPLLEEIAKSKFADDIPFRNAERIYGFAPAGYS